MIQIDMQMPKCCDECPFADATFHNGIISLYCITPTGRSMYAPDLNHRKDRPEWCPLKEQPELVHCGECKHRSKEMYDYYGNPNDKRYVCQIHDLAKKPDWFCADGERK